MTLASVYKNGFIAELIGRTNVTAQANRAGEIVMTPVCTRIPVMIIGNQQKKSVATMAATFLVI